VGKYKVSPAEKEDKFINSDDFKKLGSAYQVFMNN